MKLNGEAKLNKRFCEINEKMQQNESQCSYKLNLLLRISITETKNIVIRFAVFFHLFHKIVY